MDRSRSTLSCHIALRKDEEVFEEEGMKEEGVEEENGVEVEGVKD